jgi:hypothetical protein
MYYKVDCTFPLSILHFPTAERGTKFLYTRSDSSLTLAAAPLSDFLFLFLFLLSCILCFYPECQVNLDAPRFQPLSKHRYMLPSALQDDYKVPSGSKLCSSSNWLKASAKRNWLLEDNQWTWGYIFYKNIYFSIQDFYKANNING